MPRDRTTLAARSSGVYPDGWLQRRSLLVLPGGKAGLLVVHALALPTQGTQRLQVLVHGAVKVTRPVPPGPVVVRVPLAASAAARRVELRWSRSAKISGKDPRQATAYLQLAEVR
jgi:hypothetical protein